jgi:RloB-like protein
MSLKGKQIKGFEAKRLHLAELKAVKKRKRGQPNFGDTEPSKSEKKSFLIICEGQNTEPDYFNQFKLSTAEIVTIGLGDNTFSLVQRAVDIRNIMQKQGKFFDFVWCVFDADPKPDNPKQLTNFINAINFAKANDIEVAYSNQAFEYWLLLHFDDHQGGAMDRKDYHDKINNHLRPLGCYYDNKKSKRIESDFFEHMLAVVDKTYDNQLVTRQDKAIQRAKRILNWHEGNGTSPEKAESSTTVFRLIEEFRQYI